MAHMLGQVIELAVQVVQLIAYLQTTAQIDVFHSAIPYLITMLTLWSGNAYITALVGNMLIIELKHVSLLVLLNGLFLDKDIIIHVYLFALLDNLLMSTIIDNVILLVLMDGFLIILHLLVYKIAEMLDLSGIKIFPVVLENVLISVQDKLMPIILIRLVSTQVEEYQIALDYTMLTEHQESALHSALTVLFHS